MARCGMTSDRTLATFQQTLLDALFSGNEGELARLRSLLAPDSAHRFDVYVEGYRARLHEALIEAFPAVRRILGEENFQILAHRFADGHRSRTWDLGRAGNRFPAFLQGEPELADFPFLGDLARLEHAVHLAFFARGSAGAPEFPADADVLARWRPRFAPAAALVDSPWPIATLRALVDAPGNEAELDLADRPEPVLVWRDPDLTVRTVVLPVPQAELMRALQAEMAFGEALETVAGLTEADVAAVAGFLREPGVLTNLQLTIYD